VLQKVILNIKMSSEHRIFSMVIPKSFVNIFEEFEIMAGKDEEFIKALEVLKKKTKSGEINKRIKKNKLTSLKVRFLIANYVRKNKQKYLKNAQT